VSDSGKPHKAYEPSFYIPRHGWNKIQVRAGIISSVSMLYADDIDRTCKNRLQGNRLGAGTTIFNHNQYPAECARPRAQQVPESWGAGSLAGIRRFGRC